MLASTLGTDQVSPTQRTGGTFTAHALLVIAVALGAYSGGVGNRFVEWDDHYFIRDNPALRSADGLGSIWSPSADPVRKFYPLTYTMHWVEYQLWRDGATGYFLVNVALHAACSVLVLALGRGLAFTAPAALIAALLFAVHPMHPVTVAWIASRKNVLSTALALASMLMYVHWRKQSSAAWYAGALAAFAGALLAKTAVVTLPLSLLLYDWLIARRSWRSVLAILPMIAGAALLAAITAREEWTGGQTAAAAPELRPLAAAGALWFYVYKLVLPLDLRTLYPMWDVSFAWPWVLALASWIAVALVCLWAWRRGGAAAVAAWCIAHFALSTGPALGLVEFGFLVHAPVSDHFVYLGSVGILLLLGALLARLAADAPAGRAVILGVVLMLGFMTWQRVRVYHDPITFWTHTHLGNPESRFARQVLAERLEDAGGYELSVPHWLALLELEPNNAPWRTRLGAAYQNLGKPADAVRAFTEAVHADPNYALASYNLGVIAAQRGQFATARRHLEDATRAEPNTALAHLLLAEVCLAGGDADASLRAALDGFRAGPDDPRSTAVLLRAVSAAPDRDRATAALREALAEPTPPASRAEIEAALRQREPQPPEPQP